MSVPSATAQWICRPKNGLDALKLEENAPIPALGRTECLVKIEAVSLNYRDVGMTSGNYPSPVKDVLIPTSDGAGTVVAVGSGVTLHKVGDRVSTLFNQGHQSGFMTPAIMKTNLGGLNDGPLREYAAYPETGLVPVPKTLSMLEASTLPCAAVTAWNCFFGLDGRSLKPGDYVLTQGTGGVSIFAAQFALAFGAKVIATTSSERKADLLRKLGVQHIINYKDDPNWGETAKKLTPNQEGVHHVLEVGGETTIAQSLKAIRIEGVISIIGFVGGKSGEPLVSFIEALITNSVIRGVHVGSREQNIAMNKFIDAHGLKPIVDSKIFQFREAREAYQYLQDQKHFGKVVIEVGKDSRSLADPDGRM